EFVTNREEHGEDLSNIINSFNLNSKIVIRKENHVVYLKEGEQIADILNIIGAHQSLLKFEDIRIFKDMRNNINRLVNCETANLGKTINASLRQVENIQYIDNRIGIEKLPKNLQEIALLRLKYREASLKELGKMLEPPVGKSGVNHRLRRIDEIAEDLKGKENKS
ncbi:MAG: DNA-binding protein WhiA, partial [Tissierellia bacterium]|nr:DNA-binding protein WhiA [Tissierellia bacterium]